MCGISMLVVRQELSVLAGLDAGIRSAIANHDNAKQVFRQTGYDLLHRKVLGVGVGGTGIGWREDRDWTILAGSHLGSRLMIGPQIPSSRAYLASLPALLACPAPHPDAGYAVRAQALWIEHSTP